MKRFLIKSIVIQAVIIINCFAQTTGWQAVQSNTTKNLNSIFFYDYQTGYACGNSGVVIKSLDSGKTWQSLQSPVAINLNDCFMFSTDCFLAVGDSGMVIGTYDGGINWFVANALEIDEDIYSVSFSRNQGYSPGLFGADSQTIVLVAHTDCSAIANDAKGGLSGGAFWDSQMLTPQIGFVAGENSFSQPILGRTTDSGINWDFVSFYLDGNEGRATGVIFTDQLTGFISALVWDGRGAIAKTSDNGNNWTTTFFNTPLWDINFPLGDASQLGYCVGDSGTILKTLDEGESWNEQISGTNENLNKVFFINSDFGFAVGDYGIILRTTNGGGSITNIDNIDGGSLEFNLQQNYPNPFNPSTTINFSIKGASFVSLKVFNALGQEIESLVAKELNAGTYNYKWDAKGFTSGIYFYKLQAGNFIETKKMILLK